MKTLINSGDEIYDTNILNHIFDSLSDIEKLPDVIYGETEIINQNRETIGMRRHSIPDKLTWRSLRFGMKVCHQSVIVKREQADFYDINLQYSSDYDWLIKVLKKSENIYNSKLVLSKFMDGGTTKQNLIPGLKERFHIMRRNYGFISTIFIHLYLAINLLFYYCKNKRF